MLIDPQISRVGSSEFLDNFINEEFKKEAFSLERISHGTSKIDPFEGKVENDIWKISGNKLLRKK